MAYVDEIRGKRNEESEYRGFTLLSARGKGTMTLVYDVGNIQPKFGREICQVAGNFPRPQRGF